MEVWWIRASAKTMVEPEGCCKGIFSTPLNDHVVAETYSYCTETSVGLPGSLIQEPELDIHTAVPVAK